MNLKKKISWRTACILFTERCLCFLPDKPYLKLLFRLRMGRPLNLKDPEAFSDKLQWLKLYNRRPEYTMMVDKYAVKDYVAGIIGKEHVIPTFGVWNRPEDIDWNNLPQSFVLKCTHDSGTIIIVRDKSNVDKALVEKKLRRWIKRDYYRSSREWPYKNVPRRIIAESFIDPRPEYDDLYDFKFFTFNGEPDVLLFCSERKNGSSKWDFYDMNMQKMDVSAVHHKTSCLDLKKIISRSVFDEMKNNARMLSKNIPFVSVDQYYFNHQVYFGELTFYSGSGFLQYNPPQFDKFLGDRIIMPE